MADYFASVLPGFGAVNPRMPYRSVRPSGAAELLRTATPDGADLANSLVRPPDWQGPGRNPNGRIEVGIDGVAASGIHLRSVPVDCWAVTMTFAVPRCGSA